MKRHVADWVRLFYADNTLHCFQCHVRLTPEETAEFEVRSGLSVGGYRAAAEVAQSHRWRMLAYEVVRWFRVTFIRPRCEPIG